MNRDQRQAIADTESFVLWDKNPDTEILWQYVATDGTCVTVYKVDGVRRYRAMEYTEDEHGEIAESYGYDTEERFCYMGQRYRGLFGPFESEVFGRVNGRVAREIAVQTGPNSYVYADEDGNRTDGAEFTL